MESCQRFRICLATFHLKDKPLAQTHHPPTTFVLQFDIHSYYHLA